LRIQLEAAQLEVANLKKEASSAVVWQLSDVAQLTSSSKDWEQRDRVVTKASGSWEMCSQATSFKSIMTKTESLAVVAEFGDGDRSLFNTIEKHFFEFIWQNPAPGEGQYSRGTRPATVEEVEAEAKDQGVDKLLKPDSLEWYRERQALAAKETMRPAPQSWPRRPRTRVDDEVKKRKVKAKQALVKLVTDMGEETGGPAAAAPAAGIELPPKESEGGQVSTFIYQTLLNLAKEVNEPVAHDSMGLAKGDRNKYLTRLMKTIDYNVIEGLVDAIWPKLQDFVWAEQQYFDKEHYFLQSKKGQA
jgi:hypothetical protein